MYYTGSIRKKNNVDSNHVLVPFWNFFMFLRNASGVILILIGGISINALSWLRKQVLQGVCKVLHGFCKVYARLSRGTCTGFARVLQEFCKEFAMVLQGGCKGQGACKGLGTFSFVQ